MENVVTLKKEKEQLGTLNYNHMEMAYIFVNNVRMELKQ